MVAAEVVRVSKAAQAAAQAAQAAGAATEATICAGRSHHNPYLGRSDGARHQDLRRRRHR